VFSGTLNPTHFTSPPGWIEHQGSNPGSPAKQPLDRCTCAYKSRTDLCEVVDVEAESAVVKPAVGAVLVASNSLHKTRHVHGAAENQVTGHSQSKRCHYTLVQNVAEHSPTFKILSLLDTAVNS